MRARQPDFEGYVKRDGVRIGYEVFEPDDPKAPTVVLLPAWSIIDSRHWKAQVPYLSREFRVVTFDPPGNGRSDRPARPGRVRRRRPPGVPAGGARRGRGRPGGADRAEPRRLVVAGRRRPPPRPGARRRGDRPGRARSSTRCRRTGMAEHFEQVRDTYDGWQMFNRHFWQSDLAGFAEFFFRTVISEPHSSKQIEDAIGWAAQTTAESLIAAERSERCVRDRAGTEALLRTIDRPVLVIRGSEDHCRTTGEMVGAARLSGGREVVLEGADHLPHTREPVIVNRLLRDFVREVTRTTAEPVRWTKAARPAPAGALPVVADRSRARRAGRRDRRRAAPATARRPGRLAGPAPGDRGARPARRTRASRVAAPGRRVRAHRERGRRARPARVPGDPADGRDPGRQLHGVRRPGRARALRPLGRRRGLGARLLPAREPGAEAVRVRLADRLRRLAADGRRRRGGPDRRLQRRDGRADRPLPAAAGPGRVRRQPRRPGRRPARAGPAQRP